VNNALFDLILPYNKPLKLTAEAAAKSNEGSIRRSLALPLAC
jgi:hypothetical protein